MFKNKTERSARNFILTINNPTQDVVTYLEQAKRLGFTYGAGQLERGEKGTEHVQIMFGGKKSRFDSIKKLFPGAHIESCKHPRKSFEYCCKEETRVGPNHKFGTPPVLRNNKSDIAEFNKQIINLGAERAVEDGLIKIGDYKRFKISVELYKSSTRVLESLGSLDHEWIWGDPGVGKSKYARN